MKSRISHYLTFFLLLSSCNNKGDATAEIKFSKDTFLFERLRQGDSVIGVFDFINSGKADLIIKKLGLGCGCTNAYVSNDTLKPNERSKLFATYHSGKDSGSVLKTIVVESNTTPVLHTLFLKGNVE
jgi:hypothetical protein